MSLKKLGFLASHSGTNMQCIIDACKQGRIQAVPAVVISNNGASSALDRAEHEGIPAFHISSKTFSNSDELDRVIRDTLIKHEVYLVVLAGFMKKIGPETIKAFKGRIINIHPALLPKYGGKGMFGKNVHEEVLASGDKESGATVHLVDDDYDTGPVLAQRTTPVLEGDNVDSLSKRVLAVEHEIYSETIDRFIKGEIG